MLARLPFAAVAFVIALAASSSTAHAEEEWYGYQVAATDVGGWALIIGGVKLEAGSVAVIGAGALFLGGPIVHAAHGNLGRAGISLAARGGGALLGGIIGIAATGKSKSDSPLSIYSSVAGAIAGAFVGYLAGAIVDIAVIAREEKDPAATPRMLSFGGRF